MDEKEKNEKRIQSFDAMRALACLAVVLLHVVSTWRDDPSYGYTYYMYPKAETFIYHNIVALLVRWAVPVFFMMSGVLYTQREGRYKKHIIKSLLVIIFFGTVYALAELMVNSREFCVQNFKTAFLNMLQDKSWAHMWFMYAIVGCYILVPIIKEYIDNAEKKNKLGMLLIFIIFLSVIPTINALTDMELTSFGILDYAGAFLYFYTGAVLYNQYRINKRVLLGILGVYH